MKKKRGDGEGWGRITENEKIENERFVRVWAAEKLEGKVQKRIGGREGTYYCQSLIQFWSYIVF